MRKTRKKIINGIVHKTCTICGEFKPLEEFYDKSLGFLGKDSRCKECILATNRNNSVDKNEVEKVIKLKRSAVKTLHRNGFSLDQIRIVTSIKNDVLRSILNDY